MADEGGLRNGYQYDERNSDQYEAESTLQAAICGDRSAIIYSIVVTCERYGVDPLAYMADVLRRLPGMSNKDDIDSLLPSNWKGAAIAA